MELSFKSVKRLSETEFELDLTYVFTTTFKIPADLMKKYEEICRREKFTKSDLLRAWITSFLALTPAEQDVIIKTYSKIELKDRKIFGIRLVDEVLNELDEIARRNNVSRSDVIRSIMVFKIERYERSGGFD
ncbi:MAG: ribbon-helix-helix protein, CopG family [Sulfolobus sp.]